MRDSMEKQRSRQIRSSVRVLTSSLVPAYDIVRTICAKNACADRVIRGGSWYNGAANCRATNRHDDDPGNRYDSLGFRVVRRGND